MKRFQMDRPIMVKRWRIEWEKHGRDFGNCHCGNGMGTMRKHRPYESHPFPCGYCENIRMGQRTENRTARYAARRWILEGLSE